jgi:hypothetical protein
MAEWILLEYTGSFCYLKGQCCRIKTITGSKPHTVKKYMNLYVGLGLEYSWSLQPYIKTVIFLTILIFWEHTKRNSFNLLICKVFYVPIDVFDIILHFPKKCFLILVLAFKTTKHVMTKRVTNKGIKWKNVQHDNTILYKSRIFHHLWKNSLHIYVEKSAIQQSGHKIRQL